MSNKTILDRAFSVFAAVLLLACVLLAYPCSPRVSLATSASGPALASDVVPASGIAPDSGEVSTSSAKTPASAVFSQAEERVPRSEEAIFVDPNGHRLEIHATGLEARLRSAREEPWKGLELFV